MNEETPRPNRAARRKAMKAAMKLKKGPPKKPDPTIPPEAA